MSQKHSRPLSPHLQIYRWQWTATYSILHRLTGIALSFGALLIAAWIISVGLMPEYFSMMHGLLHSWFGITIMLGFCWSLSFHLMNGIRHLFWDMGKGLNLESGQFTGHFVFISSLILTGLVAAFTL